MTWLSIIEPANDNDKAAPLLPRVTKLFHFFFSGKYDIQVDNNLVGGYDSSGSFGELALMYNMPRAATIIATTDGTLWAMVSCP